jgi:hypothetical protein
MNKLRAEIIYSYHFNSNEPINLDTNESLFNQDRENDIGVPINTLEENEEIFEIPIEETEEDLDDENNQLNLENEFDEYLQDWIDMLNEEEFANSDNFDESDIINDNNIHPANDTNAKWKLTTLFKNNLELPF